MSGPLYYQGNSLKKTDSIIAHEILLQNCLSRGSVKLSSADPLAPPLIDPNYFSHPYDVRMAIEALRQLLKIAQSSTYRKVLKGTLIGPWLKLGNIEGLDPDTLPENVLEDFARETITQGLHGVSTCKMSLPEDPMGVVNSQFQVRGVKGLRVADISVCPILTR
jgi:choline dehydrogenase-like flavoprotein